jgi:hypothetical protein
MPSCDANATLYFVDVPCKIVSNHPMDVPCTIISNHPMDVPCKIVSNHPMDVGGKIVSNHPMDVKTLLSLSELTNVTVEINMTIYEKKINEGHIFGLLLLTPCHHAMLMQHFI